MKNPFRKDRVNRHYPTGLIGEDPYDAKDYIKKINWEFHPDTHFSLREWATVKNQGKTNACTGYSASSAVEILLHRTGLPTRFNLSPRWVYWWSRQLAGLGNSDNGSYVRTTLKALQKYGVVSEESIIGSHNKHTTPAQSDEEFPWKLEAGYERIPTSTSTPDAMRVVLNGEQLPIVVGINLYKDAVDHARDNNGLFTVTPVSKRKKLLIGGHAMCVTGFSSGGDLFEVLNSWGDSWGDSGYAWVPADYFINRDFCLDVWTFNRSYW